MNKQKILKALNCIDVEKICWKDSISIPEEEKRKAALRLIIMTAEAYAEKRPHGHWVVDPEGNTSCERCGCFGVVSLFCPNCGADMRALEGEEDLFGKF